MISSGAATVITVLILSAIAVVASIVGFVTTGVLGMDWSVRAGLADALTAVAICIACVLLLGVLRRGEAMVPVISAIAGVLSGGVVRHVARRLFGRSPVHRAP
jgi:hypothetical protein